MRKQADNSGVHFKQLLWCLRRERGEQFGRLHFHAVIAGFPLRWINKPTCFAFEKLWSSLGGGHAKVTVYSASLDGLDYILKPEEMTGSTASRFAGDYHEMTKFGSSCDVTLSESVVHCLDGRRGYRRDTHPHTTKSGVGNTLPSLSVPECGDNATNGSLPLTG